jgi:hypothetical protein
VIDALPVTEEQSTVMGLSAISSVQMLARAVDEVRDGFSAED